MAITTGLRRLLSERELRGVIAHELAHIKNRDILIANIAAMAATVIAMVASIVKWGAKLDRGNRQVAFHTVGDNPATASLFICSPLSGRGVTGWFSTHPPIAERIDRLLAMARSTAPRPRSRGPLATRARVRG